jgi:AcrR family transcriptional regulator
MMSLSGAAAKKTIRKDVARNRALLLESARVVFAERGLDATLDDIATHAGLGVGTAYRHFANKQEIAAEVLAESSGQVIEDAQRALLIDDPWAAIVTFFDSAFSRMAENRGLHQTLMTERGATSHGKPIGDDLVVAVTELFDRAKAAGVLRPDADPTDAGGIFAMIAPAFDMSAATDPTLWRRYLAIWLDGLRVGDRAALPGSPLRVEQLPAALGAAKRH